MNMTIARMRAGLKQYEVAKLLEVASQTVSRWENGHIIPPTEQLMKLAKLYNVTTDYLLEME